MKSISVGFVCLMWMSQSSVFAEPVQAITIKEEKRASLVTVDRTLAVRISDISENLVLQRLVILGGSYNQCGFSAIVSDPTRPEGLPFPSAFKSSYVLDNQKQAEVNAKIVEYVAINTGGEGRGNGYSIYGSVKGTELKKCTAEVVMPAISKLLEKLPKVNGVPVLKTRMAVEEPFKGPLSNTTLPAAP